MELTGIESAATYTPKVAKNTEKRSADATKEDTRQPAVSVSASAVDIEEAIAGALTAASAAGQWDVVAQLAKELEARRLARAGNVVALGARKHGGR